MTDAGPRRSAVVLALVGIVLVAISLRSAVASVSPIVAEIDADIGFGALALSIVGAVPPIAFATSGLFAPPLVRRFGLEPTLIAAIAAMIVGNAARALAPNAVGLVIATLVTLSGVGVANVLLPSLVNRWFPGRAGALTALYTTVMSVGTAVPALIAVPVADAAGWRASLAIWVAFSLIAAPPWIALALRARRGAAAVVEPPQLPRRPIWRSPTAWAISAIFVATASTVYAAFAWLPSLLVETAGVTPAGAGALLAVFAIMGFPASILVPLIASRSGTVTPLALLGVALLLIGGVGLLVVPAATPVLWVVIYGLGPLLFPLALFLVSARSRTHLTAVAASGFVQLIGYGVGAAGPVVVGILRDSTGGWTAPLIYLMVIALPAIPAAFVLRRPRMIDDDLSHAPRAA